jgi:WD40 repeat protein
MHHKIDLSASGSLLPAPEGLAAVIRVFGELRFHTDGDIAALAFAADGALYSVEESGVLRRWNTSTGQPSESQTLSDLETLWAFSGNGRLLASASDDLSLWDVASGRMLGDVAQPSWVTALAWSSDGGWLATGHDDGIVRIWTVANERLQSELRGHENPITAMAFSPDGKRLATAGEDRIIIIWEVVAGGQLGALRGHTDHIQAVAWHPRGHQLVSAAWDRTARLWNTTTFEPIVLLNSHADQVTSLCYSPGGELLVSADSAPAIHVWDPETAKDCSVLEGHQEEIRSLAFSPDGQLLASGGADRVIRLWDPHQGQLLSGKGRPVLGRTHLAVSPDGARLASTCGGAQLRRGTGPGNPIGNGCLYGRDLSVSSTRRFAGERRRGLASHRRLGRGHLPVGYCAAHRRRYV